jgi:hypothetical protein
MNNVEHHIKILTDNYKINLNDIQKFPIVYNAYENINIYLYNTQMGGIEYQRLINIILKQYRPSNILPNTIGSFLFGCFQETYGDVNSSCSPLCMNSIQKDPYKKSISCDNQIWIQTDNDYDNIRFRKLGTSKCKNPHAYVYVKINFEGFNLSEINEFKRNGISKIQLMVTYGLKHHNITKMIDIDKLPIIEDKIVLSDNTHYYTHNITVSGMEDETYNTKLYISVIAIFIIIFIVAQTSNK